MDNLYEHIEQLGKKYGYKNITELCRAAGVPRATMTELKMGRSKDLSKPNAQKFAGALGLSLDAIYGTPEKQDTPAPKEWDRRQVSDNEIKFALFGDAEIDDDVLDEVKRFAQFAREQRRQKEQQTSD